jgi:uncharacterized membrane protein
MNRPEIVGRGQQVAIVIASGIVPTTFTGSLSQRSWKDQGLITGLATGSHFLLTVLAQDALDAAGGAISPMLPFPQSWSPERRKKAATGLVDAAAVPLAFGVVSLVGYRDQDSTLRAVTRQILWRIGLTGVGATVLAGAVAAQRGIDARIGADGRLARIPIAIPVGLVTSAVIERIRQRDTPPDHVTDPARSNPLLGLVAGAGVVLTISGLAIGESWVARQLGSAGSRILPGSETTWRRAGHAAALGSVALATHALWGRAMRGIESGTARFDEAVGESAAGVWTGPNVSGDPASLVAWETMGREGRRHVATVVRPEPVIDKPAEVGGRPLPELSIRTVMQEEARAKPIAVFVGLDSATTGTGRVDLALAEMDRTDAWSRSLIMLISPTGTGYVNYVAVACAQYMSLGDVATVTLQYSKRPSPLSLGKIAQAKEQNRLLWLKILERVRLMEPEKRPKVVLFGESLGAYTSQAPFQGWGTLGPEALGIDRALWIGTPASSAWKNEIMRSDRADVDRSLVAVVNDYEQYQAIGDEARNKVRFVLLSHDNDGVTKFDSDLLTRRPSWLGPDRPSVRDVPGRSPRGIPASMRWRPITTFFQTLIDMKNAQIPGAYRAWAHDYRPDLPDFIRDVFELECSAEQLERIKDACEKRELFREAIFA